MKLLRAGALVALVALAGPSAAQAPPAPPAPRARYSSLHDRPKTLGPGDLCYDAYAAGIDACHRIGDRPNDVYCSAWAAVAYDHCRWRDAEPDAYDCHHGHEDSEDE